MTLSDERLAALQSYATVAIGLSTPLHVNPATILELVAEVKKSRTTPTPEESPRADS